MTTLDATFYSAGFMPEDRKGNPIPTRRGVLTAGLTYQVHGKGTIQVTGGNDATDTFQPKVNSVAIVAAPVVWATSHAATATAIAVAINAFYLANYSAASAQAGTLYYFATVSTDTVTVHQVNAGTITGALICTVVNDAAATVVDFAGDTDTPVAIYAGITSVPTGNYLTLAFDEAQLLWMTAAQRSRIAPVALLPDNAQAFELFAGRLEPGASGAAPAGRTITANATREIPWMDADTLMVISTAGAGVWDYELSYIA